MDIILFILLALVVIVYWGTKLLTLFVSKIIKNNKTLNEADKKLTKNLKNFSYYHDLIEDEKDDPEYNNKVDYSQFASLDELKRMEEEKKFKKIQKEKMRRYFEYKDQWLSDNEIKSIFDRENEEKNKITSILLKITFILLLLSIILDLFFEIYWLLFW